MFHFGMRKSHDWHARVDHTARRGGQPLLESEIPNPVFPWAEVRLHTDIYLSKKVNISTEECDRRLLSLIQKHGATHIAVAACAHRISINALRNFLFSELQIAQGTEIRGADAIWCQNHVQVLRAVITAHHINPLTFTESDSQVAQALVQTFAIVSNSTTQGHEALVNPTIPRTPSQNLKVVMDLFMAGIPGQSLLRLPALERARNLSLEVSQILHALRQEGQWHKARKESLWLSMLLNQHIKPCSGWTEALHTTQRVFRDWRAWAVWSPDLHRLLLQERLSAKDRAALYDLLALEGPDFLSQEQATLREALIVNSSFCSLPAELGSGRTRLKVRRTRATGGSRSTYERLSNAVNAACIASTHEINLLVYLCCNGSPIDEHTLTILEANSLMASSEVSADVLLVLQPQFGEYGGNSQMAAVMRLLSVLAHPSGQALRDVISSYLVCLVSASIREMQGMLGIQLDDFSSVSYLYTFGKGVQEAQWIHPLLDDTLGTLISRWPTADKFASMDALQKNIRSRSRVGLHPLIPKLYAYYAKCLTEPDTLDPDTKILIEALIHLSQQDLDYDRNTLAYAIAQDEELSITLRCDCLKQLPTVPNEFIKDLIQLLDMTTPSYTWINVVHALAELKNLDHDRTTCWRSILYIRIEDPESKLLEHSLSQLTAERWFQCLSGLQTIFADRILENGHACPDLLLPALHEWTHRICCYRDTILRLESEIGSGPATQSLLVGFKSDYPESVIQILELLEYYYQSSDNGGDLRPEVRATIMLLDSAEGGNAKETCHALSMLAYASGECGDVYLRVLEVYQQASKKVAHVFLVVWLKYPYLTMIDKWALESLAKVLDINLEDDHYPVLGSLDAASHYATQQVTSLLAEAEELARLRKSLKVKDPEGLSALLAELEIEDTSPLEDEIANLPPELVDVVEMVAEDIVELHFPLNHLKVLQRAGMGTTNCESLIVRLVVGNSSLPSGFCIHFEDKMNDFANTCGHSPWLILDDSSDGGTSSCHGLVNRATFQLGYILSRHLLGVPKPLEETYKLLKESLDNLSSNCIICGTSVGIQLRRSGVCQSPFCATKFLAQANLDIHLDDLREDAEVGVLLLTATEAAAASGNAVLLPGCPVGIAQVTQLLSNLPAITSIRDIKDTNVASKLLGKQSVDLLKWIYAQYGGYLVSASGQTRIPSMPGVIQFLLANAAPNLEKNFAAQMGTQPTRVVFHGTSLDRLYSILCNGLQVCSGNSALQRHGASYGKGIYVASEPATSMTYASTYTAPYAGSVWHSSSLNDFGVLLACEASGNIPLNKSRGIHVIPDPNMLILRYIFLVPTGVNVPAARHIVPAMTSVFASLRSGSL